MCGICWRSSAAPLRSSGREGREDTPTPPARAPAPPGRYGARPRRPGRHQPEHVQTSRPGRPLRSPAEKAGKTRPQSRPDGSRRGGRYGARPRRPGRHVSGGACRRRVPAATEPGREGREDRSAKTGDQYAGRTTAATEPGREGREDRAAAPSGLTVETGRYGARPRRPGRPGFPRCWPRSKTGSRLRARPRGREARSQDCQWLNWYLPLRSPAEKAGKTIQLGTDDSQPYGPLRSPAEKAGKTGRYRTRPDHRNVVLRSPAEKAGKTWSRSSAQRR